MKCQLTTELIQGQLDGTLSTDEAAALRQHLADCPDCRAEAEEWQTLQRALRELPAPAPPPDLTERLWANQPRRRGLAWPMAAAASLALALAVGPFMMPDNGYPTEQAQQTATVQMSAGSSETVQLSLSSPRDMKQVELTLILPEHLSLEGYSGQQVIRWKTDLLAGDNRLALPLKARVAGDGELVTRVQHAGGHSEELRVRVKADAPARSQRQSNQSSYWAWKTRPARNYRDA